MHRRLVVDHERVRAGLQVGDLLPALGQRDREAGPTVPVSFPIDAAPACETATAALRRPQLLRALFASRVAPFVVDPDTEDNAPVPPDGSPERRRDSVSGQVSRGDTLAVIDRGGGGIRLITKLSAAKPRFIDWGTHQ